MEPIDIQEVLRLHDLWLQGEPDGVFALLPGTNLQGANLQGANLTYADFRGADLRRANLTGSNLRGANLIESNLQGANLTGTDLTGAYLLGSNLDGAILPDLWTCPREGSFRAFKKVRGCVILELEIPEDARRTSSLIGRKCRCDKAVVLGVVEGEPHPDGIYTSLRNPDFKYVVGEVVKEPGFDDNIREECMPGIHFFMTIEEARSFL